MNIQVDPTSSNLASAMLNLKVRPRAVVGYGVKIFHPSPPNYDSRSPVYIYLLQLMKIGNAYNIFGNAYNIFASLYLISMDSNVTRKDSE